MIGHRQLGTIASVPRILPHEFFEQVARSIQVGGPCARTRAWSVILRSRRGRKCPDSIALCQGHPVLGAGWVLSRELLE